MDSAILVTPASGSTPAQYGFVDKHPSIWPWDLKPQSWMDENQQLWITPYSALTILAILLTIIMWLGETIYYHGKILLEGTKSNSIFESDKQKQKFSELEGINIYLPVHKDELNQYFTINVKKEQVQEKHLENLFRRHHTDTHFDLVQIVPADKRDKVLGTIKWYADSQNVQMHRTFEHGYKYNNSNNSRESQSPSQSFVTSSKESDLSDDNLHESRPVAPVFKVRDQAYSSPRRKSQGFTSPKTLPPTH